MTKPPPPPLAERCACGEIKDGLICLAKHPPTQYLSPEAIEALRPKPPPGSQEWLALNAPETIVLGGALNSGKTVQSKAIEAEYRKGLADNRRYLVINAQNSRPGFAFAIEEYDAAGLIAAYAARQFVDSGKAWVRYGAVMIVLLATGPTVKDVEALRAELSAVHSDLGDAAQSVFDLFEDLKQKEIEIAKTIAAHRDTVAKLTDTIERLKADLAIAKAAL